MHGWMCAHDPQAASLSPSGLCGRTHVSHRLASPPHTQTHTWDVCLHSLVHQSVYPSLSLSVISVSAPLQNTHPHKHKNEYIGTHTHTHPHTYPHTASKCLGWLRYKYTETYHRVRFPLSLSSLCLSVCLSLRPSRRAHTLQYHVEHHHTNTARHSRSAPHTQREREGGREGLTYKTERQKRASRQSVRKHPAPFTKICPSPTRPYTWSDPNPSPSHHTRQKQPHPLTPPALTNPPLRLLARRILSSTTFLVELSTHSLTHSVTPSIST